MSTSTGTPVTSMTGGPGRLRVVTGRVLEVLVVAVLVLADTLAFNQLATQSPTDGIIQLSVLGVGVAGPLLALALLVLPVPRADRALSPLVAGLAVAALVGWRARWPIGWAVLACAAAGIVWIVLGMRSLTRIHEGGEGARLPATVAVTQGLISLWFAVLVAIDARHVLFG